MAEVPGFAKAPGDGEDLLPCQTSSNCPRSG
jgi:hypothetical protein